MFDITVVPRYSKHLPQAADNEGTVKHIIRDERKAHAWAINGLMGDAMKAKAETIGLHGIVWRLTVLDDGKYVVYDFMTRKNSIFKTRDKFLEWRKSL